MAALEHLLGGEGWTYRIVFFSMSGWHRRASRLSSHLLKQCSIGMISRFFQAVAVELRRARAEDRLGTDDDVELETAIRQVVSDAVTAAGVIDI